MDITDRIENQNFAAAMKLARELKVKMNQGRDPASIEDQKHGHGKRFDETYFVDVDSSAFPVVAYRDHFNGRVYKLKSFRYGTLQA